MYVEGDVELNTRHYVHATTATSTINATTATGARVFS